MADIKNVSSNFKIYGDYLYAKPFGKGHINETFLVTYNQAGVVVNYIIRKININVFKQPETVISNSVNISLHIKRKYISQGVDDISRRTLTFVEANDNKYYHKDKNKDYWCCVLFFEGAYTLEFVHTKEQAYLSARAFGEFQKMIVDVDIANYKDTISDFHNLPKRMITYDNAIKANSLGRLKNIDREIKLIEGNRAISEKFTELIKGNKLPIRITHNDTKINNVMLDKKTGKGLCVIDLDTVMPGIVLNDFGDMVRTSTSPVEEDEKDCSKVVMRLDIFEALIQAYLSELADVLTEVEISNLVYGAKLIVYEQIVRFITDYLVGDTYYQTAYPDHNLVRARNQLSLLESIIEQEIEMESIVKKYANAK